MQWRLLCTLIIACTPPLCDPPCVVCSIRLLPHMKLIFEIRDLKFATPATATRAGILYISEVGGDSRREAGVGEAAHTVTGRGTFGRMLGSIIEAIFRYMLG